MKKLALLLTALGIVSAAAYAAPELKVTSVGQFIEIDNASGSADGDIGEVYLGNTLGLAYGDWTLGFTAFKTWIMDTDDGVESANSRLQYDIWKKFDNYSLGFRWRANTDYDRFLARAKYSFGAFSGDIDFGYESRNDDDDRFYGEGVVAKYSYGPFALGYYFEYFGYTGDSNNSANKEQEIKHQLRAYASHKLTDALSVGLEYRYQFAHTVSEYENAEYQEETEHIVIAKAAYDVTENLTVDGYYRYDFETFDGQNGASDKADEYYGEFYLGWTYKF